MTHKEFTDTQDKLKVHEWNNEKGSMNPVWNFGCVASLNFQFHLIAQIDDSTNVKMGNFQKCQSFPLYLQTRLNWSKNVNEERDAPW